MLTPIKHEIPSRLRACITTHRIMDDERADVVLKNRSEVLRAVRQMPFCKQFSIGDLRKHLNVEIDNTSIRGHLANLVLAQRLVTSKQGDNRYYKRVA